MVAFVGSATRRSSRVRLVLLAALGFAVIVAACGGDVSADVGVGQTQVFGYDDIFAPEVIEVELGTEVEWRMEGDNPHNVFASDGSWESPITMTRGQVFRRTFTEPGVYPYFCTFHGTPEGDGMAGYVIVGDVPDYEKPQPDDTEPVEAWTGKTLHVPAQYSTIQEAVDDATPGDMVLIAEGVYNEAVTVRTPSLTIRGSDRNETILDGEFERSNGLHVVADAVAVENMTARNYEVNGFYWTGVTGYRGSYLTAHNNGDYGIYAFDSTDGLFEHSYGSGNRDSAFYIGQCYPCNAVVTDVVSEANGLGFSGTNAGGDLYLINSVYRDNMGGIVPNSLDSELLPPQREVYIGGNLVIDNNNAEAPTKGRARLGWGEGIVLGGGVGNLVEKNLVVNHNRYGIITTMLPDKNIWNATDNVVRENTVVGTGLGDFLLTGPLTTGNCFEDNLHTSWTTSPWLNVYHSCSGLNLPYSFDLYGAILLLGGQADAIRNVPPGSDYRLWPVPEPQEVMPDPKTTPGRPAFNVFVKPDVSKITTPELPPRTQIRAKEITVSGVPLTQPTFWTFIFSLWAYFLPLALAGAWIALALWDISRRQDEMSRGMTIGWFFAILLMPFLGVIAYFAFGKSQIEAWLRGLFVGGGAAAYLIVLVALIIFSGAV